MIFLFDVDGVLVHSRAYHLGLRAAVGYFGQQMGLTGSYALTEHEVDVFEAHSITVEWESCAIAVAGLLLARLEAGAPPADLPFDQGFWAVARALATHPRAVPRPDFAALATWVGDSALPGERPALAALRLWGAPGTPVYPVLEELLGHCYDVDRSAAHQVVQNYALGEAQYEAVYGLKPHFASPSLLATEDAPFLNLFNRDRLLAARAAGRLWFTLYTARPSLPPREVVRVIRAAQQTPTPPHATPMRGYTPEAEMAMQMVGLMEADEVPVMAVGRLEWAARRIGRTSADLVKPSPIQPLAAIGAARTGREVEALEAALAVHAGDPLPALYHACAGQAVHVFEDSASSLQACARAVDLLNAHGLGLTLTRHGIAPAGSRKHANLTAVADHVHADINAALAQVL